MKKRLLSPNLIFIVLIILLPLFIFSRIFRGYVLIPGCSLYNEYYPWKDFGDNYIKEYCAGKTFWGTDPLLYMYPLKMVSIENIKKGIVPLWNPYAFNGAPLLANNQSAVFYPLNLLYFIFDFNFAWSLITILQPIGAGLFMYIFLRQLKLSSISSFWGSLIFSWSGVMTGYFHHQVVGHTVFWIPFILYFYNKSREIGNIRSFLFSTIGFVFLLTAGHFQFAFYSLLLIALVVIIDYGFARKIKVFVLALLLALGIASVQIFPTLEFIFKSFRDANILYGKYFLPPPQQLWRFLSSGIFGDPTLGNWWGNLGIVREHQYIGLLGLIFAFSGIIAVFLTRKTDKQRMWKWPILVLLIIAFSIESPVTRFIYSWKIPLWSTVTPGRFMEMVVFPLAVLSAYGIEHYIVKKKHQLVLCIIYVCIGILLFIVWNSSSGFNELIGETVARSLEREGKLVLILTPFIFLLIMYRTRIRLLFLAIFALFVIQAVDLIDENLFFTNNFIKSEYLYADNQLSKYISDNIGEYRFVSFDTSLFSPMSFIPSRISSPSGYDPLILKLYVDFYQKHLEDDPIKKEYDNRAIRYTNMKQNVMDMLGIKYFLTRKENVGDFTNLVGKFGGSYVYENKMALPLFYLASFKQVIKKSDEEILNYIFNQDKEFDPRKEIILLKPIDQVVGDDVGISIGNVKLINKSSNSYSWKTSSPQAQILLISETYDKGWKIKIDGLNDEIFRANYINMAVKIPEGQHLVEMYYLPTSFRVGLIISSVSLILLLVVFVSGFSVKKKVGELRQSSE